MGICDFEIEKYFHDNEVLPQMFRLVSFADFSNGPANILVSSSELFYQILDLRCCNFLMYLYFFSVCGSNKL